MTVLDLFSIARTIFLDRPNVPIQTVRTMQIKIHTKDASNVVDCKFVVSDFAVHLWRDDAKDAWNVTHIPTGRYIFSGVTGLKNAKEAAQKLASAKSFSEGLSIVASLLEDLKSKGAL